MRISCVMAAVLMMAATGGALRADEWKTVKLDFTGGEKAAAGYQKVGPGSGYSAEKGYGFEFAGEFKGAGSGEKAEGTSLVSEKPFFFSADVPEGNYRVTVTLGGPEASVTTVKAELRRLMLENEETKAGEVVKKSFVVNVRVPEYPGGAVRLKGEREKVQEAWAWDPRITLEFSGKRPSVAAAEIERVEVPTVYLLGDSTSCDQSREPYASWGQMFTRFFKDDVAIANHGESGESVGAANGAKRFDKILAQIKPGDFFFTQFGHNDMKGTDAEVYGAGLAKWAQAIKGKGATAVIVTPVARHAFKNGKMTQSLANERGDFVAAAKKAAADSGAVLIDLNAMSTTMYEALGEEGALALFEHQMTGGSMKYDKTHHSPYGAYEVAKCVAEAVRKQMPALAGHLSGDFEGFDPSKPDKEAEFKVPPTPLTTNEKPFGN